MICCREVLNAPPSRTGTPARYPSGPRTDDRRPRASAARHRARAVTRIRPAAWLTASVTLFLLAVAGYALLVHAFPQYYWTQIDTAVYRDGGIAVRNQPAMLYALGLGAAKLPFIYPPFAALLFAAGGGASFRDLAGRAGGAHDRAAARGGVPFPGTRWAARRPGEGGGGVCDRRGEPLARTGRDDTVLRADQPRAAGPGGGRSRAA